MPRQLRIEFENAVYHVLARGNQRQLIFLDRKDRETFMRTLDETCSRTGFRVLAWVLMGNHYHVVFRTPNANLVEGMRWLQNTYTRRFNVRHDQWGRLFGDRYKAILVESGQEKSSGDYLSSLVDYVHLNPARSRVIQSGKGESILDYEWSGLARGVAQIAGKRYPWHDVAGVLALNGLMDTVRDRRKYIERLDKRIRTEDAERCGLPQSSGISLQSTIRRGWYWGSQSFRDALLQKIEKSTTQPLGPDYASSSQGKDHSRRKAEDILFTARKHFNLNGHDVFQQMKRGDRRRVAVAWAIWKRTSMPQSWIADATGISSAPNVSQQVHRFERLPVDELSPLEKTWKARLSNISD